MDLLPFEVENGSPTSRSTARLSEKEAVGLQGRSDFKAAENNEPLQITTSIT